MATTNDIIQRCGYILQDTDNTRWTPEELILWTNAGCQEIASLVDSNAVRTRVTLLAGVNQRIPADGNRLIAVFRNAIGGKTITKVDRYMLDLSKPGWPSDPQTAEIKHYTYDPRVPYEFFVYPPSSGAAVDISYNQIPAEVTSRDQILPLEASYINALTSYVLAKAFAKESEQTYYLSRSQAYQSEFLSALGLMTDVKVKNLPLTQIP